MSTALVAPSVLMEREDSTLRVELVWYGATQLSLCVQDADGPRYAYVPPDRALDAFEHPYSYVDPPARGAGEEES